MRAAKPFFTDGAYGILDPMKGGAKPNGFTIVETLIVIAVSGAMFVSAALLISGQQAKAQFRQSINQVAQQLRQTIGDVTNGYYPTQNAKCVAGTVNGSLQPVLTAGGGSGSLGTNSDCVLVGKTVQFMSSSNVNDVQHFVIYTMAGLRQSKDVNGNMQNVTNLADAHPIAIAPGPVSSHYAFVPDASVTSALGGGLSLSSITYNLSSSPGSTHTDTFAFAVFADPATSAGAPGGAAGAPQVGLYIVDGTNAAYDSKTDVSNIDNYTSASFSTHFKQVSRFTVCLAGGAVNQSGLITIDGTTAQPSVTLAIRGNRTCS